MQKTPPQKVSATSERIKQIMLERGLKQIDIIEACRPYCEKFGIKIGKNDLSQYVSGKVRPRQDKLSILASALGVSETWLMGYGESGEVSAIQSLPDNIFPIRPKPFPLLGDIACGKPIFADEDRESYVLAGTDIEADFCLRCKGDSMTGARIMDGDIVFIREQPMVENGEIAAVIIEDEATLKRVAYYPEKNMMILKAENPKYGDLIFIGEELNTIRILGKAVAFQSDVK